MKNLIITAIASAFLLASCTYKVKDKYDCNCKEEATEFKRTTYDDLVAKWGAPSKIDQDAEKGICDVVWTREGLFKDARVIQIEFNMTASESEPHGRRPVKVWCEGKPYMGGAGMVTGWSGPYE